MFVLGITSYNCGQIMQTLEIPIHEWVPFLNEFSKRHQGESCTLQLLGRDFGAQVEANALPLIGVSVDLRGDDCEQIDISVGDSPERYVMHAIEHPSCIRVARTDRGEDRALQIESDEGPVALLKLNASNNKPA
jgi:hypothetical protein